MWYSCARESPSELSRLDLTCCYPKGRWSEWEFVETGNRRMTNGLPCSLFARCSLHWAKTSSSRDTFAYCSPASPRGLVRASVLVLHFPVSPRASEQVRTVSVKCAGSISKISLSLTEMAASADKGWWKRFLSFHILLNKEAYKNFSILPALGITASSFTI